MQHLDHDFESLPTNHFKCQSFNDKQIEKNHFDNKTIPPESLIVKLIAEASKSCFNFTKKSM